MGLKNIGERFKMKMKKIDGSPFFGQMLDIPDTSRVSNFLSPRRYLRTKPITSVSPRDVVVVNGVKFIVAEHGDGFYREPIYKHFKLFEVNQIMEWYSAVNYKNPVTGVSEINRGVFQGQVYMSTQPKTSIEDGSHIQLETQVAVVDKPVAVDDKLGNYIVTKSDYLLGVTLVELKRI